MKKKKKVWEEEAYYKKAKKGSLEIDHPGMEVLKDLTSPSNYILDLGCGEGTRLNWLVGNSKKKGVGIDISTKAIGMGRKSYPKLMFFEGDLENLDFKDNSFDLVYSAYVLEHLTDAEKMIKEAIRVTKKGGHLVLIATNFGAPNRASPLFKGSRMSKLLNGFINDLRLAVYYDNGLNWRKIDGDVNIKDFKPDCDTTLEPYIGTLIKFLKKENIEIEKELSCWDQELPGANVAQQFIGILGKLGLYPFWMWGPHLVVVGRKI